MTKASVALAGILALSSCTLKGAAIGGVGVASTITGMGLALSTMDSNQHNGAGAAGALLIVAGLVTTVTGMAIGVRDFARDDPPPDAAAPNPSGAPPLRAQADVTARREHAFAVTQQAAKAAREGDCVTVGALDAQVHDIDADFHDTVFVRDVAIARCLQP